MNNIMTNTQPQMGMTPPPLPTTVYHIAVNGQASGPFDKNALTQMALSGQLLPSSLVWKQGMTEWMKADSVDDLKDLFMPPIPPVK